MRRASRHPRPYVISMIMLLLLANLHQVHLQPQVSTVNPNVADATAVCSPTPLAEPDPSIDMTHSHESLGGDTSPPIALTNGSAATPCNGIADAVEASEVPDPSDQVLEDEQTVTGIGIVCTKLLLWHHLRIQSPNRVCKGPSSLYIRQVTAQDPDLLQTLIAFAHLRCGDEVSFRLTLSVILAWGLTLAHTEFGAAHFYSELEQNVLKIASSGADHRPDVDRERSALASYIDALVNSARDDADLMALAMIHVFVLGLDCRPYFSHGGVGKEAGEVTTTQDRVEVIADRDDAEVTSVKNDIDTAIQLKAPTHQIVVNLGKGMGDGRPDLVRGFPMTKPRTLEDETSTSCSFPTLPWCLVVAALLLWLYVSVWILVQGWFYQFL